MILYLTDYILFIEYVYIGLGPPILSPSHHPHHSPSAMFPTGSSPVSASPIPMTVTSPIGKHGGSLGALTASVNALQRPASTSGHYLVQHSPKSPPCTALVSGVPSGIRHLRPIMRTSVGGKSDQAVIITTQTPIFNRSHHSQTTTTMVNLPGTTTMSTLVRVTPSMQQAIHHTQQRPLIIQPRMMGSLGLITADGPLIRGVSPTMVNPTMINPYNGTQSKLHSALTGFGEGTAQRIHLPPSPHGSLSLVAQVQPQGKSTSFTMHPTKSIAHTNITLHPQMRHIAPAKAQASHIQLQPKRPPPYPSGPGSPLSHHALSSGVPSYAIKHSNSKVKTPSSATKPGTQVKPVKLVQQQTQRSEVKVVKPVQREKKSILIPVPVPPLVVPTAPIRPDVTSTVEPQQAEPPPSQSELVTPQPRAEVVGVTEGVARVERQIPKAVVKPQVLTHVIDGFIIEESKEPFSVSLILFLNNIKIHCKHVFEENNVLKCLGHKQLSEICCHVLVSTTNLMCDPINAGYILLALLLQNKIAIYMFNTQVLDVICTDWVYPIDSVVKGIHFYFIFS